MKFTKIVLFVCVCLVWLNVSNVSAQTEFVTAYPSTDFRGNNFVIRNNWAGSGLWDRKIKSIRVPSGYRVTLYTERNFRGTQAVITEDWNPGATAWWTTRIRSIRVERTGVQPPPSTGSFPVIYAGTNFDGPATAVERDQASLRDWDGSPHTIRSVRVPDGWYLVLYTRTNYRGKSYNLSTNMTFAPGDEWYNKIRSIKVYRGTPPRQPR